MATALNHKLGLGVRFPEFKSWFHPLVAPQHWGQSQGPPHRMAERLNEIMQRGSCHHSKCSEDSNCYNYTRMAQNLQNGK